MDGYGVRLADVATQSAKLRVVGEAPAGMPYSREIKPGEAVRLFTGSVIPKGAQSVIMQENVTRHEGAITVNTPQSDARHIRRAGIDFNRGDTILPEGRIIGASEIAVLASSGHKDIQVTSKLTVAFLTGGDELVPLGAEPQAGQIINSNPYALAALIEDWGHRALILPTAKDTKESISAALGGAIDADIISPVGGASVGDYDHMRAVFRAAGLEMIFEKVAVKPGKPTWFGKLGAQFVLGLPGNPASALVCAHVFLGPLIDVQPVYVNARLADGLPANGPRENYLRAQINLNDSGLVQVSPLPRQDSSLMTPFLRANGLIQRPVAAPAAKGGDMVKVLKIGAIA
jgi:molybdopterin molybdotransferase